MAKGKKEVVRHLMTDQEAERYLTHYVKKHGWTPKEAVRRIRHCAATRWAALERWKPKAAPKAAKKGAKKVKKAA